MKDKEFSAEDFMKALNSFPNTCASCKYFDINQYNCRKRNIEVERKTPKCDEWRYAL